MFIKYFNHKWFVLVDEYDNICTSSIFKIEEIALENIIKCYLSILDKVLTNNEKNVRFGFITGILYICTIGLSKINNIISYQFLNL